MKMITSTATADAGRDASGADQTRLALVQAALKLFGQKGFDGTSTREIATAARANIGSIAYHFGGKEGLRSACAEHIVDTVNAIAAQAIGPAGTFAGFHDAALYVLSLLMLLGRLEILTVLVILTPLFWKS